MIVPVRNPCARATRCRNYSPGQTFVPLRQSLSARATESYHGTYFGAFTDLKPWQRQRLEEAFEEGRRRVGIKQLAGDTQLSRQQVLSFMKWWGSLEPDVRNDLQASRLAADQAVQERRSGLAQHRRAAAAATSTHAEKLQEIRDLKRQRRHENNYQQAAKLMEVMFLKGTRFPKHSLVTEICDMTGVRKGEVIEWFQNRRREGKGGLYESAEEDWDEFK